MMKGFVSIFFLASLFLTPYGASAEKAPEVKTERKTSLDIFEKLFGKSNKASYVRVKTQKGECIIRLYNETPLHRDNFIKLARNGYFNGALFHRVINTFMIQGGDPDSRGAAKGQVLGDGGPDYTIPAEFKPALFHKKGVLAAARDDNPAKASSGSQFYLVHGKTYTDEELDRVEKVRLNGRKIPEDHRKIYKTVGGAPFLDQNYTVFGETVKGFEMIDAIAVVDKDQNDRPLDDIPMQVFVLKRKEVRKLEKELKQNAFRSKLIMK